MTSGLNTVRYNFDLLWGRKDAPTFHAAVQRACAAQASSLSLKLLLISIYYCVWVMEQFWFFPTHTNHVSWSYRQNINSNWWNIDFFFFSFGLYRLSSSACSDSWCIRVESGNRETGWKTANNPAEPHDRKAGPQGHVSMATMYCLQQINNELCAFHHKLKVRHIP